MVGMQLIRSKHFNVTTNKEIIWRIKKLYGVHCYNIPILWSEYQNRANKYFDKNLVEFQSLMNILWANFLDWNTFLILWILIGPMVTLGITSILVWPSLKTFKGLSLKNPRYGFHNLKFRSIFVVYNLDNKLSMCIVLSRPGKLELVLLCTAKCIIHSHGHFIQYFHCIVLSVVIGWWRIWL